MFQNASFSQSKKKQIEALNLKIDSMNQVLIKERNAQKTSIGSLEIQESKSKQKVDSLTKEINSVENQINSQQNNNQIIESEISRLKKEIDLKKDSLKRLLPIKNNTEISFKTVKIGNQTWMTEDLSITKYNNGDNIPEALNENQWNQYGKSRKGCFARLNNGTLLYNGYALKDSRGLVPDGFKIPSNDDFKILADFLGGGDSQSGIATLAMATYPIFVEEWVGDEVTGGLEPVEIASNGKSNFNAKMGGFIYDNGTNFQSDWNNCNFWWTSTPFEDKLYAFDIGQCSQDLGLNMYYPLAFGFAVRCIRK